MVISLFITSCKKDDAKPFKKIQTVIYNNGDYESYEYNTDGKLSKLDFNGDSYKQINYSGSVMTIKYYVKDTAYKLYYTVTPTLNAQGYITKMTYVTIDSLLGSEIKTTVDNSYTYDNSGYCTKSDLKSTVETSFNGSAPTTSTSSTTDVMTYTNGNLTLKTSTVVKPNMLNPSSSTTTITTTTYEYFLDKENSVTNERMGMTFMGKSSKNLLRLATAVTNNETKNTTFLYDYDQDGLVIKSTEVDDNKSIWTSYSYK